MIVASAATQAAYGQSASQITPRSFEPAPPPRGGEVVIPESTGPEAPAGADALFVEVADIAVEGGLAELRAQEQALGGEFAGKRVSAAELFAAARRLEQAYIAAGYGLVRVVLPQQRLKDGATVRLVVVDGFVERVDTAALPPAIRERVEGVLAPLVGRRGLTMAAIERALLLAADTPGTALRSTLAAGTEPGAAVLVIDGRYQPVTGFLSLDDSLAEDLGTYSANIGLDFNSLLGLGESVYLRAGGWPSVQDDGVLADPPRNRVLAAGISLPLGHDGLSVNLEATDARATPRRDAGDLGSSSTFQRVSARLSYALIRSRSLSIQLQSAFEASKERVLARGPLSGELSLDRLRVLRAGGSLNWYPSGGGIAVLRLTGTQGIDGLGARQAPPVASAATPLSRQGADPDFRKLEASLSYVQPLLTHLALDLAARAQTGFNHAMANSEQIGLSGENALSTVPSGRVQGDSGLVLRGELQFPFRSELSLPFTGTDGQPAEAGTALIPYLFGAHGRAWLARPTALENDESRGNAFGAGLRLGGAMHDSFNALNIGLEYGRYRLDGGAGNGHRFSFTSSFQF